MSRFRIALAALIVAELSLVATSARAQDEDAPISIGPPLPPPPTIPGPPSEPPEHEASSLDPAPPVPTPTPAPLALPLPLEPRAPRFGSAGVTVITGSSVIGASYTTYDESDASSTTVSFSPGIDYFVAQHISLGLDLSAFYQESRSYRTDGSLIATTTTSAGLGARVGVGASRAPLR